MKALAYEIDRIADIEKQIMVDQIRSLNKSIEAKNIRQHTGSAGCSFTLKQYN